MGHPLAKTNLRPTCVCLALLLLAVSPPARAADGPALELTEHFGVNHPDQVIDFDLASPRTAESTSVIDSGGKPVPFQLIDGGKRIALRTDLPAGAHKSWRVVERRGEPASPKDAVVVREDAGRGWYEITNGMTGVRVPADGPAATVRAPALGVLLRSGKWLDAAPALRGIAGGTMRVRFIERGPLVVVAEVSYAFKDAGGADRHYRCTVKVQAGQPSVLFDEEADAEVGYTIPLESLHPTQARYRGHHSTSKAAGYEADGRQYRQAHERPQIDAFVDLTFDAPRQYRRLPAWDPWIYDSGWYWQLYDKDAPADADMVDPFAGRASRALNPRDSGVNVAAGNTPGRAELVISCKPPAPATPDARQAPTRFSWGLFVATKSDLAPPDQVQPVGRQMNLHAGTNLNKVARLDLDFPDPPGGYGSSYMPRAAVERMIARLRADAAGAQGRGYYNRVYDADSPSRDLIDFWADPSGERARKAAAKVRDDARGLLDALVNDNGVYSFQWHYWMGGLTMARDLLWIDQLLASPAVSAEDKAAAKAAAVLFASVLWDNDFVPMDNNAGINLGTPNMPVQESGYRDQFALFLSRHPMMRPHVDGIVRRVSDNLRHDINEYGSHMSSVHYVGAGMGPTLSIMQQLKTAGIKDFFRDDPRVAKFAHFFMSCATPPEVRFGAGRKMISVGDGSTEASELFGQMATGFADVDPDLSRRLMHLWRNQGMPHSSFFGTTLLKIDEDLPDAPAALPTANFPGYHTVLRQSASTPLESAVWLINGNHYWDHSHADQGEVVIYALGAPLSLDWGSTYEPRVDSAFMHSLALPERLLGHTWDADNPPVMRESPWGTFAGTKTEQEAFRAAEHGGSVRVRMAAPDQSFTWTRSVALDRLAEDRPVILIRDTYAGRDATSPKVFTLNLMAEGDVDTPAGKVTPPPRIRGYQSTHGDKQELPSAGKVFDLPPGVHRLAFTGQTWPAHPTHGVDFDVFVVATAPQQAHIGNWAHAWHPGKEAGEFEKTNHRPFEERQHILRVRGTGSFAAVLVPFKKGQRPTGLSVRQGEDGAVLVTDQSTTVKFSASN